MNELSLFSGAGGGLLASHLLGWTVVGYVEWNDYCQQVLAARIKDGYLHDSPIFSDIRTFISQGYAKAYQGMVDVVTAGFPCQPFSVAGKREGADDERNMWPATIECIRQVRPRYCLLENVPGLLTSGYFGTILGDLAESGYDCRWRILSAAEVGAPHLRKRLWIVGNTNSRRLSEPNLCSQQQGRAQTVDSGEVWEGCQVADTHGISGRPRTRGQNGAEVDYGSWWTTEPDVGRVVDGLASRMDRLKALGNGQVSAVAATAWKLLS